MDLNAEREAAKQFWKTAPTQPVPVPGRANPPSSSDLFRARIQAAQAAQSAMPKRPMMTMPPEAMPMVQGAGNGVRGIMQNAGRTMSNMMGPGAAAAGLATDVLNAPSVAAGRDDAIARAKAKAGLPADSTPYNFADGGYVASKNGFEDFGYGDRYQPPGDTNPPRPKAQGFYGNVPRPDGGFSSELSIDTGRGEIPSMVPGLTPQEMNTLTTTDQVPASVANKADSYAAFRQLNGQAPFAGPNDKKELMPVENDPMVSNAIKAPNDPPYRGVRNFKDGGEVTPMKPGLIKGPGTGKSDSIEADLPVKGFVLPIEVVKKYGADTLQNLIDSAGPQEGGQPTLKAKVSNEEFFVPPNAVEAFGKEFWEELIESATGGPAKPEVDEEGEIAAAGGYDEDELKKKPYYGDYENLNSLNNPNPAPTPKNAPNPIAEKVSSVRQALRDSVNRVQTQAAEKTAPIDAQYAADRAAGYGVVPAYARSLNTAVVEPTKEFAGRAADYYKAGFKDVFGTPDQPQPTATQPPKASNPNRGATSFVKQAQADQAMTPEPQQTAPAPVASVQGDLNINGEPVQDSSGYYTVTRQDGDIGMSGKDGNEIVSKGTGKNVTTAIIPWDMSTDEGALAATLPAEQFRQRMLNKAMMNDQKALSTPEVTERTQRDPKTGREIENYRGIGGFRPDQAVGISSRSTAGDQTEYGAQRDSETGETVLYPKSGSQADRQYADQQAAKQDQSVIDQYLANPSAPSSPEHVALIKKWLMTPAGIEWKKAQQSGT